jgi:tetratricopeptide (TPR) repeat protein
MESLFKEILGLISKREFDRASELIESAREKISDNEVHRLVALSAVLQRELGNIDRAIELMKVARQEAPTWLPHLYNLSDFLMEAKNWQEAIEVLDALILRSEEIDEHYFLIDARFRKILCLKALDRRDEIQIEKKKIPPGSTTFIDREYRLEDLD